METEFVSVKDRLPEEGQAVEVLRVVNGFTVGGYCKYEVVRTTFEGGVFLCDSLTTGYVVAWLPALHMQVTNVDDYPGLRDLFEGANT